MARYYICGQVGSGVVRDATDEQPAVYDPIRPENPDELAALGDTDWGSAPEVLSWLLPTTGTRRIVTFDDEVAHEELAYDPGANPNGYDWFEVADDGTVTFRAA